MQIVQENPYQAGPWRWPLSQCHRSRGPVPLHTLPPYEPVPPVLSRGPRAAQCAGRSAPDQIGPYGPSAPAAASSRRADGGTRAVREVEPAPLCRTGPPRACSATHAEGCSRLTPLLAGLMALCTLLLPGLSSGPMWGMVIDPHAALCRRHWWRNLLYIHNYFGFEDMCLTHTHQLGIDMQLFLVAPLLVYPLWRWPRGGALFLAALAAWSTALRYSVVVDNELSTIVYFGVSLSQMFRTATLSYILPTHRLTVYIMGVALGYVLHRVPESFRFSKVTATLGWLFFVPLGLLPVFGPHETGTPAYRYDVVEAARYAALAPILWSSFVCWGIFACSRGSGGWLRDFVCWRGWVVFTRIAFALYLAQFPVFFYNVGSNRYVQFYSIHSLLNFGEFALIMVVSVILSLTFEMPFQELWKTYDQNQKGTANVNSSSTSAPRPDRTLQSTAKRKSA